MAFTEQEKQRWLEARRLGLNSDDALDDDEFEAAIAALGEDIADEPSAEVEGEGECAHCIHCGISIDGGALCAACE